jgi:hypothetical protein
MAEVGLYWKSEKPLPFSIYIYIYIKTHNCKSSGSNKLLNYWLKAFPATHSYIMKILNTMTVKCKQMPDWLITGITLLLPKSKENMEPKNYQQITCSSTKMYKIADRNTCQKNLITFGRTWFINSRVKRCHSGSKGCKD